MTDIFGEFWERYKHVPYHCKPILEWIEDVGNEMQHGLKLDESQQHKLSIAMRHAADTCRRCTCPEEDVLPR